MGNPAALDRPEIASRLLHPRPDPAPANPGRDAFAAAADGTPLYLRVSEADPTFPTLLLFHGNGEVASDYDDLAPLLAKAGLNLAVAEFRGYGKSGGTASAAALLPDARASLAFVVGRLEQNGGSRKLIVMGRSLGSACALELAYRDGEAVDALVVESGFAHTLPLLATLGVDAGRLSLTEADGFSNLEKIAAVAKPTLLIHGERDGLIPPAEAKALFAASPAANKELLLIPKAGHNDLLFVGLAAYLDALKALAASLEARS